MPSENTKFVKNISQLVVDDFMKDFVKGKIEKRRLNRDIDYFDDKLIIDQSSSDLSEQEENEDYLFSL